ncbi:hypothetical protein G2285_00086 [Escherichia phage vB_EcoM_G2285]|nr:hypothetical protein G2285_00086 [Escherichia phage vB_EcoM_G2285]
MRTETIYTERKNGEKTWKFVMTGAPNNPTMATSIISVTRPTKKMIRQYKRFHRDFYNVY